MEIWIVEEGEKRGPLQGYEVRERIEKGELTGEELAWHKDCDEWMPLKELEVFRSEFEPTQAEIEAATPPPLPKESHPFLRFWARWFDVCLYWLVIYGVIAAIGMDLKSAFVSPLFNTLYMLPYVILDGLAIHVWKTTPGKFLLGLRVVTDKEGNLELGAAMVRSVRVYILGLGLTIWILPMICNAFSLWYTLKNREAPWDAYSTTEVKGGEIYLLPVILFISFFAIMVMLLIVLLIPPMLELAIERMNGTV